MQPSDSRALVRRYLALHKVGLLPLNAYRYISVLMSGGIVMDGLMIALYRYQTTAELAPSMIYLGVSLAAALGLWMIRLIFGVDNQKQIAENAVEDYLENYLKSKLDGEYGYSHKVTEPENYENALQETAAARAGIKKNPVAGDYSAGRVGRAVKRPEVHHSQTDPVDARIVEDVLKEFLC
jgi:hypothetical protein